MVDNLKEMAEAISSIGTHRALSSNGCIANFVTEREPTTNAAAKVFAIPELLEDILLHLDMKQLFSLQRVNSSFHGTIKKSSPLRQKMWLDTGVANGWTKNAVNPLFLDKTDRGVLYPVLFVGGECLPVIDPNTGDLFVDITVRVKFDMDMSQAEHTRWPILQQGSWRKTKLSRCNCSINVRQAIDGSSIFQTRPLGTGDTLGDLADMLTECVR